MSMEIMKQAFDALREMHYALGRAHDTMRRPTKYIKAALLQGQSAITALRPVIEQAEPEDVKKIESKWVGLTYEDVKYLTSHFDWRAPKEQFVSVIEAKLKEKNSGN
jgi:hypothetical protein